MKNLTEGVVVSLFREEYQKRKTNLSVALENFLGISVESDKEGLISTDTKVKHKETGLLYTVDQVEPDVIVLKTPNGELFSVDSEDFQEKYVIS